MKRSRSIKLVLAGSLSAGALAGCSPSLNRSAPVSTANVYTNNHYLPGVGYYHAPYRAWYSMPYNQFDPATQLYFHGGAWNLAPHESITNISSPTPAVAQQAQTQRTDTTRSGFGSTSRNRSTWS